MRSWTSPEVPSLSELGLGNGPAVQVHDTSSRSLRPVDPQGTARLYVCGITPYDATHMGHAATYLTFDLLQRVWRDRAGTPLRVDHPIQYADRPAHPPHAEAAELRAEPGAVAAVFDTTTGSITGAGRHSGPMTSPRKP